MQKIKFKFKIVLRVVDSSDIDMKPRSSKYNHELINLAT